MREHTEKDIKFIEYFVEINLMILKQENVRPVMAIDAVGSLLANLLIQMDITKEERLEFLEGIKETIKNSPVFD